MRSFLSRSALSRSALDGIAGIGRIAVARTSGHRHSSFKSSPKPRPHAGAFESGATDLRGDSYLPESSGFFDMFIFLPLRDGRKNEHAPPGSEPMMFADPWSDEFAAHGVGAEVD